MSESVAGAAPLRLNLGSGHNPIAGFVNVDKFGSPDVKWDLEVVPWPWPDNSVGEVNMNHVLEHLGESVPVFFGIIKELYRVCRHGAVIHITVPHPRHDDFLGDPTHVRAFTPESFNLYNKAMNREWQKNRYANSPLGLYLDVDFVVSHVNMELDEPWGSQLRDGKLTNEQAGQMIRQYNNVVKQIRVEWVVNKPA